MAMQTALAASALLMGLAGGPHCVAMCGAACAGVIRIAREVPGGSAPWLLHAGRIGSYAAAGALAATAMGGLAMASEQVAVLRPVWMLLHAFVLAWGLVLAVAGRQPDWFRHAGSRLAARLRPMTRSRIGVLVTGALWVAMPCGLLYSALLLASLGNSAAQGALAMALFGVGSAASLLLAPWLWQRLRWRLDSARQSWGTRIAGAALIAVALQALWIDLQHQIEIWCR